MALDEKLRRFIAASLKEQNIRIVVLDDDPTGIQTVHGCLLLTCWDDDSIAAAFRHSQPFFYLLTNTRAMTRQAAEAVTREAMESVLKVWKSMGCPYKLIFISRSDSTLRGHYPLETDVMKQVLSEYNVPVFPCNFLIPAFLEVGRVTIDGIHYLKDHEKLIPVAETEFAHDNVFAYHHSDLKGYIEEKTGQKDIRYVSLAPACDLGITRLVSGNDDLHLTVDATEYVHLQHFAVSLLTALEHFDGAAVIRSSSSLPKALSGIEDKPVLEREDLLKNTDSQRKGFFIVGSHVKKTTAQLENLLACQDTCGIEVDVQAILDGTDVRNAENRIADAVSRGLTPVVYTSRKEIRLDDADARQHLGQKVSDYLVEVVRNLPYKPAYMIAKGGITSNDILTKGLQVRTATVMGQIQSGVPCIMTATLPYVIFPGNVGDEQALAAVYKKLTLCFHSSTVKTQSAKYQEHEC